MQAITLGESGLKCSRLAYGCWRVTGVITHPPIDDEHEQKGREAITAAYEAGYTLFDLADIYSEGLVEEVFGRTLKEVSGMRDSITVTTKCGIRQKGDPDKDAPHRYDQSRDHIVASCDASLKRMGLDCIDMFLLHRPDYLLEQEEVAKAFDELKQAGKVREFGVSNFTVGQLDHLQAACSMKLICNQVEISLFHYDALEDGSLDYYQRHGVTPLAWSPLAQGRLGRETPVSLRKANHTQEQAVRDALHVVALQEECSPSAVALAWLLRHPAGIVPIVGSTNPDHIRDATRADGLQLSREEWYRLTAAAAGEPLP
ncbi:MAG: aldo/keto reductase [Verrucomicrobiales bacterium]|jgi:predicted oxidoreductase|nr:aldo/keto reductase [Verrucomicrobiales bacterium]